MSDTLIRQKKVFLPLKSKIERTKTRKLQISPIACPPAKHEFLVALRSIKDDFDSKFQSYGPDWLRVRVKLFLISMINKTEISSKNYSRKYNKNNWKKLKLSQRIVNKLTRFLWWTPYVNCRRKSHVRVRHIFNKFAIYFS